LYGLPLRSEATYWLPGAKHPHASKKLIAGRSTQEPFFFFSCISLSATQEAQQARSINYQK